LALGVFAVRFAVRARAEALAVDLAGMMELLSE
jgi:hypothetical protein